jgi:hypothetical protein
LADLKAKIVAANPKPGKAETEKAEKAAAEAARVEAMAAGGDY